jgi:hypothetical protein
MNHTDQNPTVSKAEFDAVLNQVAKDAVQVKPEPRTWASNVEFPDDNKITRKQKILVVNAPQTPLSVFQKFEPNLSTDQSRFRAKAEETLQKLRDATQAFTNEYGKPNLKLIRQKEEVASLENALREAKSKLVELEEQGDSVDRFSRAILQVESAFAGLVNIARIAIRNGILLKLLDHVPAKVDDNLESQVKYHKRTHGLLQAGAFYVKPMPDSPNKESLEARAKIIGEKVAELVEYVTADEQANASNTLLS